MAKKKTTRESAPSDELRPTLGPFVCAWIEKCLVHAEGDFLGEPFRLRPWQKRFLYEAYELRKDGSRQRDRALLGLPKGNGKTELGAAIGCVELAGPVVFDGWDPDGKPKARARTAPDIPVAAASFEQADTLFGAARTMISEGPLAPLFDVFDTEIMPKKGTGRMYRVAAVAGTNDGRRPTFLLSDELHEWTGNKERVHLVLSNGRAKRADAWELSISTAGWDPGSLLGRVYAHGQRVEAGEVEDPRFLFRWSEAPDHLDLKDPEALEIAIRAANPAAGDFLPIENVVQRYREIPEHEFRRYYLNQWTAAPDRWFPPGQWEACEDPRGDVPDGTPIVLGFDGSYSGDSTAIVGCTLEESPHLFVVEAWEKPAIGGDGWRVDILDVENAVREACGRWQVEMIGCDPFRWQRSMAVLQGAGLPVVEWPSHLPSRMSPACTQFQDAVAEGRLSHDGDERLAKHIGNAVVKIDSRGPRITKDHEKSDRKIDLAVAAVLAFDLAVRTEPEPEAVTIAGPTWF